MTAPRQRNTARGVRLQKAMAEAGIGARRDCEAMILAGRVRVNGRTTTSLPCFVDPARDIVELDGEAVSLPGIAASESSELQTRVLTYLLVNKPKGVITPTRGSQGRRTVLDLVPLALRREQQLHPVGRLDTDSTGLVLITNDSDLARQLTHPKLGIPQEYRLLCAGLADDEQLKKLRAGMYLVNPAADGSKTTKRAVMESVRILKRHVDRARGDRTLLSVTLREAQNREVRRMLARVGLKLRELERVSIGPLRAPGLKPGESKLLGKKDVQRLREALLS